MRPRRSGGSMFQIDAGRSLIADPSQRAKADSASNPILGDSLRPVNL
jgi:hypothetical protein